jgi:uncharacterized protein with NRDE domain
MCLIVFAWRVVPGAPLIAAANRDEFYDRPAAAAGAWPENPKVYAGRDLKGGGSWMGITQEGPNGPKFAALTNIRGPRERRTDAPSRGALVADYLSGDLGAEEYIAKIAKNSDAYNGFNLVLGDRERLFWFSNRGAEDDRNGKELAPGIYGISNSLLDAPWPKVVRTKAQFASLLCQGAPEDARKTPTSKCWPIPRARPTCACPTPASNWTWNGCCRRYALKRRVMAPAPRPW